MMRPLDSHRQERDAKIRPYAPLAVTLPYRPYVVLVRFVREQLVANARRRDAVQRLRAAVELEQNIEDAACDGKLNMAVGRDTVRAGLKYKVVLAVEIAH